MKKISIAVIIIMTFIVSTIIVNANTKDSIKENEELNYEYVTEFEDGGKDYVYIIDGIKNHCYVTPEGFNPLNATDEQLARYCYPPRPETQKEMAEWLKMVSGSDSTTLRRTNTSEPCIAIIEVQEEKIKAMDYARATALTTNYTMGSDTDAGYASYVYGTLECSQVQMNYTHPQVSSFSGIYQNRYSVGLGDLDGAKMVQAGTATYTGNDNFAWYRYKNYYGDPAVARLDLTVNPGDSIHLYISFEKENNRFTYYIANNTTGHSVSGSADISASTYYNGACASWLVSRGATQSGPLNIANYGTFTPSVCQYKVLNGSNWNNLNSADELVKIVMRNGITGNVISSTSSIFGGTCFTCTWHAYN